MKHTVLAAAAFAALTTNAMTTSPMISDGMVLPQNTSAHVWGTADPGEKITVTPSWSNQAYTVKADKEGRWLTSIETPAASYTRHDLIVSGKNSSDTIKNVLIGEVWLASGQSNMEMPLKGFPGCNVKNGFKEIAKSRQYADKVRFYTVPTDQSYEPVENVNAFWTVPGPDAAPEYSATAWYFATRLNDVLDIPIGIVSAAYGGSKVESWLPREILERYPDVSLHPKDIENMTSYYRPMLMYNAMFKPISKYTYNGIIWYQGCSNVGSYDTYADRLVTMVNRWREELGRGAIPFYAVEIAPFDYDNPAEDEKSPMLREAQWEAVSKLNNADMICTNDIVEEYERFNIHPGNKEAVGQRLGDLALNKTYGKKQFMAGSPKYKSHRVEGDKIMVAIDSPSHGICRNYDIKGFEIAGEDGKYYPATDVIFLWQTNEFQLSNPDVPHPVSARYGYGDFMPGNVYGGNYLPLIPFTTKR